MKLFLTILSILFYQTTLIAQSIDSFYVASWNVENLFDNVDDPQKEDEEFTETGRKQWTNERIYSKMENLAAVMKYLNDGYGPDIVGFMEVEHQYLLEKIALNFFPQRNYKVVGYESGDVRGIDTYLMYDEDKFDLIEYNKIPVRFFTSNYITRDILHTSLKFRDSQFDVFVNHWPSRRGGEERSQPRRVNAASTLRRYVDSLALVRDDSNFILLGDFNDEPSNYSISQILSAKKLDDNTSLLYNLSWEVYDKEQGTYLYNKEFNHLDHIIISKNLTDGSKLEYLLNSFEIVRNDFFTYIEGKKKGAIIPSFHSGKFVGGYSDHLPVGAKFYYNNK